MKPGETEEYAVPPPVEDFEEEMRRLNEDIAEQEARQKLKIVTENPLLPVPVDPKANEPRPTPTNDAQQNRVIEVTEALLPAYQKSSTLEVNPEEERMLRKPFPDECIEIRPAGDGTPLLYIPHIHIRERLIDAFGAGKWSVIRRREWIDRPEGGRATLYAEWVLVIRGCAVGETVSSHMLTKAMDYADALESTEGEAIRRIAAKRLGCGSQVWNPAYCREWLSKYGPQSRAKAARNVPSSHERQSHIPPVKTPPVPSQEAKAEVSVEDKIAKWKGMLSPLGQYAVDYLRDIGHLLPNETLEDIHGDHLPKTMSEANAILDAIRLQMDGGQPMPESVAAQLPNLEPDEDNEPKHVEIDPDTKSRRLVSWRKARCPGIPKYKGKRLGELEKGELWWFCCKWTPKVWTDKQGQTRPPSNEDNELRKTLDLVKVHYDFQDKKGN